MRARSTLAASTASTPDPSALRPHEDYEGMVVAFYDVAIVKTIRQKQSSPRGKAYTEVALDPLELVGAESFEAARQTAPTRGAVG